MYIYYRSNKLKMQISIYSIYTIPLLLHRKHGSFLPLPSLLQTLGIDPIVFDIVVACIPGVDPST